jgi:hypothetical protein
VNCRGGWPSSGTSQITVDVLSCARLIDCTSQAAMSSDGTQSIAVMVW